MEQYFEWDDKKAEMNFRKHGVPFKLATQAFEDPFALVEQERIENGEQRWQTIGATRDGLLLLLVAHTVRLEEDDGVDVEIVRIISARRADRKERRRYEHR